MLLDDSFFESALELESDFESEEEVDSLEDVLPDPPLEVEGVAPLFEA